MPALNGPLLRACSRQRGERTTSEFVSREYSHATAVGGRGHELVVSQKHAQSPSAQSVSGSTRYVVYTHLSPPLRLTLCCSTDSSVQRVVMVLQQHDPT